MVRNIFMPTILSMAIFVLVQGDFKIFKVTTTDLSAIAYMVFAGIFGDVIVDKVSWAFKEGLVGYLKSVLNTHGTNAGGTGSPTYKPPANTPPDIPVVKDSEIK